MMSWIKISEVHSETLRSPLSVFRSQVSGYVLWTRLKSFCNQWYIDVRQVYHVPVVLLLELQSMVRTLKSCDSFSLKREHLKILNWSYWHQQVFQLAISGWWRKPFNWHYASLRIALFHTKVLFIWHQASAAHLSTNSSASPSHNDLICRVISLDTGYSLRICRLWKRCTRLYLKLLLLNTRFS